MPAVTELEAAVTYELKVAEAPVAHDLEATAAPVMLLAKFIAS